MNGKEISAELLRACQDGSESAFEQLYTAFGDVVWRLCYRMAQNTSDAEDLAQETWITIWSKIGSFRSDSSFSTWLYRVTTSVCLQWKRRPSASNAVQHEDLIADAGGQPEALTISRDTAARLRAVLRQLPDSLRIPLELRVYDDLPYTQIAEILGCTPSAVRMRVSRARALLTDQMKRMDE